MWKKKSFLKAWYLMFLHVIQSSMALAHAHAAMQHGLSYTLKFKCMLKCSVPGAFGKRVSN